MDLASKIVALWRPLRGWEFLQTFPRNKCPSTSGQAQCYKNFFGVKLLLLGPYSQHFIFFVTYGWAQQARVFVPDEHFQLSVLQHSSLAFPSISYEENESL